MGLDRKLSYLVLLPFAHHLKYYSQQVDKSWDTDYVDLVTPEVAIERYESYMKANPKARENYNKVRPGFISTYESLLYDRRTVAVAYVKCPWGINS